MKDGICQYVGNVFDSEPPHAPLQSSFAALRSKRIMPSLQVAQGYLLLILMRSGYNPGCSTVVEDIVSSCLPVFQRHDPQGGNRSTRSAGPDLPGWVRSNAREDEENSRLRRVW